MKGKRVGLLLISLVVFIGIFSKSWNGSHVYATEEFDYSKYDLGQGTSAYLEAKIDQVGVKEEALKRVSYWRKDALETNVRWPDKSSSTTMKEFLRINGISEEEYLNPVWSNEMEYLSIQRALEVNFVGGGHTRPNGTKPFSLSYDGTGANREVIAWGPNGAKGAIDLWASEKTYWVGNIDGVTGHYEYLIDPMVKHYGFAHFGTSWVGNFATKGWRNLPFVNEKPANLSGKKIFKVNLGANLINNGLRSHTKRIVIGELVSPMVTNKKYDAGGNYRGYHLKEDVFFFKGQWSSQDESIVKIVDGKLKGVKPGSTSVTLRLNGGKSFTFPIDVVDISSVVIQPKVRLSKAKGGYRHGVIRWEKVEGVSGYTVYYRERGKKNWKEAGKTEGSSYVRKNLKGGTTYEFKVLAYIQSDEGMVEATNYKVAKLTTLKKVRLTSVKKSRSWSIVVRWKNISGESGYQISRSRRKAGTYIVTTYRTKKGSIKTLPFGVYRGYYYKVRAYKYADGKKVYGPWSNTKYFKSW